VKNVYEVSIVFFYSTSRPVLRGPFWTRLQDLSHFRFLMENNGLSDALSRMVKQSWARGGRNLFGKIIWRKGMFVSLSWFMQKKLCWKLLYFECLKMQHQLANFQIRFSQTKTNHSFCRRWIVKHQSGVSLFVFY